MTRSLAYSLLPEDASEIFFFLSCREISDTSPGTRTAGAGLETLRPQLLLQIKKGWVSHSENSSLKPFASLKGQASPACIPFIPLLSLLCQLLRWETRKKFQWHPGAKHLE